MGMIDYYRQNLEGETACKNFSLVVRVFTKCLLQPTWESISQWCRVVYDDLFPSSRLHADQKLSFISVYEELIKLLLLQKEAAEHPDLLLHFTSILPSLMDHPSPIVLEHLLQIIPHLVDTVPSLFSSILSPLFLDALRDVQNPSQGAMLSILSSLSHTSVSEQVMQLLCTLVKDVVQETLAGNIPDVLLLRHVFSLLHNLVKQYHDLAKDIIICLRSCEDKFVPRILHDIVQHQQDEFFQPRRMRDEK